MPSRPSRLLLPLLLVALFAAACSDDSSDDADADAVETDDVDAEVSDPVDEDPVADDPVDEEPVDEEPVVEPPAVERDYDFTAISPIVEAFIEENELNGAGLAIVDREDGLIHHEHWGEFDEDRISPIASSSKMVAAGVLLRLDDDGLLDIDAPVADAVEWGSGNPEITPAQLISNSSGLIGLLQDLAYGPYLCQWNDSADLQECGEQIFTTPDDDADIIGPDEEFNYGGAQWQVAGALAEAVSGKSWVELIEEIYGEPCDLDAFDYGAASESTNPNIEGGASSTTGDYAKLLLMHLRDGRCGDNQVLSPEALDRMHTDRIAEVYDGDTFFPDRGYGMGWWVSRTSNRITDGGAFGSVPWIDLEGEFGAFLVIEADSVTGNALADLLYDPVEAAVLAAREAANS